jgi:hypothetical protein
MPAGAIRWPVTALPTDRRGASRLVSPVTGRSNLSTGCHGHPLNRCDAQRSGGLLVSDRHHQIMRPWTAGGALVETTWSLRLRLSPRQRDREPGAPARVWAPEAPLSHDGPLYRLPLTAEQRTGLGKPLKIITHPVRPRVPISLAASGARRTQRRPHLRTTTAELVARCVPR